MTQTSSKMCQACHRPKREAGAFRITQWITCCRCDLEPSQPAEQDVTFSICGNCNKRIASSRSGSMTQWIFADHICKCEVPNPVATETATIRSTVPQDDRFPEDDNESELEVDPELFPTERYKPLQQLGAGALGSVYLCRDRLLCKRVAVKLLHNITSDRVVAFQNEARVISKLNHKHIIKVLDVGITSGGKPYMVMDYFKGSSLQELLADVGKLNEEEFFPVFLPLCEALAYLHEHNVFHRDLKPSNILVSVSGREIDKLCLIDFGLSKAVSDTTDQSQTMAGTPPYMSPDMAQGLEYDVRSEIYSLGCIMFEALTGSPPFTGTTPLQVLNQQLNTDLPALHSLVPHISRRILDIVTKCLSKTPDQRFQSISALTAELNPPRSMAETLIAKESSQKEGGSKILYMVSALIVLIGITFAAFIVIMDQEPQIDKTKIKKRKQPAIDTFKYDMVDDLGNRMVDRGMFVASGKHVSPGLIEYIDSKRQCTQAIIGDAKLTASDFQLLSKLSPTIIQLTNCTGLENLDKLTGTTSSIYLIRIPALKPSDLSKLSAAPMLRSLYFRKCNLTGEHLKALRSLNAVYYSFKDSPELRLEDIKWVGDKGYIPHVAIDPRIWNAPGRAKFATAHNIYFIEPPTKSEVQQQQEAFDRLLGSEADEESLSEIKNLSIPQAIDPSGRF